MSKTILMAVVVEDADVPAFAALSPDDRRAFVFRKLGGQIPTDAYDAMNEGAALLKQRILAEQAKTAAGLEEGRRASP